MGEIEQKPTPASRLGAPENSGISTLERGQKPPPTPSGKLMTVKIQMLDDTQETFEVPVIKPAGSQALDSLDHRGLGLPFTIKRCL
ncbi:FERM, ARHGEF and pleckstrin domain-containing protein 1 [Lemmus lemmus]